MINIVLFEPEIPENTGNIIRTCYSFGFKLHLIRPYGFIFNPNKFKRSSTNHIDMNNIFEYDDWAEFILKNNIDNQNIYFFTKYGEITPDKMKCDLLDKNYFLIFGKESTGIPKDIMNKYHKNQWVRIPMIKNVISINLSNSVAIAGYEVLRQFDYKGLK